MGHAEPKPWTRDEFLEWQRGQTELHEDTSHEDTSVVTPTPVEL